MQTNKLWCIIRTLILTYVLSALFLLGLSFALFRLRLPESQVNLAVNAVYILSCTIGGFISGKVMKSRRFFWGLVIGLLYFFFLYLMSLAQSGGITAPAGRILTVLAMCAVSGMAGGMIS